MGLAQASQFWNPHNGPEVYRTRIDVRGSRTEAPVFWTTSASRSPHRELCSWPASVGELHPRAGFILPDGVPPSGQRASRDLCQALKRPGVLPTMAATVYGVEVLDLAREHGVKCRRCRTGAAQAPQSSLVSAAARNSAVAARDDAASKFEAARTETSSGTGCDEVGEKATELLEKMLRDDEEDTELAGKRRQEQAVDYDFLEKRMRHDLLIKEKECAIECRRLALKENRLEWEKERTRAEMNLKQK
ncbi:hypothetical protein HPB50_006394 [Hyalomma asiaticum]|uniref:Uncharacterized protein n=1 Tax=Hyalomma asiaticum TaxID=266040 RepID=A0ACB7TFE1_HYAAI|nr:hypothetical protein HPB50_006394 [Hyalomma asiaticum]